MTRTDTHRRKSTATDRVLGSDSHQEPKLSSIDILASNIIRNPEFGCPSKVVSHDLVGSVIKSIHDHLLKEGSVIIPGIGKLHVIETKPRKGRNPSTGESIHIPSRRKLRFKSFAHINHELNEPKKKPAHRKPEKKKK